MNTAHPLRTGHKDKPDIGDEHAQSKLKLIKHTLVSLIILLSIFIPLNSIVFNLYFIAATQTVILALIVAILMDLYRSQNLKRSSILTAAIVSILTVTVVWLAQAEYSSGAWLLFPPIYYFFLLGKRDGIKITALYALCIAILLASKLDSWPVLIENNYSAISNIFAMCLICWFLIYRYEDVRQKALDALKNSLKGDINQKNVLLNSIINSSSDLLFAKDTQLRTFLCNDAFSNAVGKQPSDLYGKNDIENGWPIELVKGNPQKGIRGFERDDLDALAGETIHNDYDPALINGQLRVFDTIKLPLRNVDGEIIGILGIARDVTDRSRAEESLRLQSEITANAAEGIVLIKASDSTIYLTNRRFEMLFGYESGELIGKHISIINAPTDKSPEEVADEINRHIENDGTYSGDIFNRKKDGSTIWTHIHVSTFQHPELGTLWITYQSDISARKQAECELIELNEHLEKLVDQRTQELYESMRMLKVKEQAKTRFLAAASHDLRQPIAAATLFLEALKFSSPTPNQTGLINKLDQSMGIFSNQLERLLDISKFDTGLIQPKFNSFNLMTIFSWLEHNFAKSAIEKGLRFKLYFPTNKPLIVRSDIALLETALMNLVSNAIKFTSQGGIMISARQRERSVLVQVWDTGIGIDESNLTHIFDEFYQVANPQRSRDSGLGLGLSICQRALCVLGSTITCRSSIGRGSVFELSLPLDDGLSDTHQQSVTNDSVPDRITTNHFEGEQVIVLEDDELVANAMASLLQGVGAEVRHFTSAEEALRQPDISEAKYFIADYSLGAGLTGLEFLNTVQQRRESKVRAVILTGDTSSGFMTLVKDTPWPVLHKPASLAKISAYLNS